MDAYLGCELRTLMFCFLALVSCTLYWCHTCQAYHVTPWSKKYKVFRIFASSEENVQLIHDLGHTYNLDPWRDVYRANQTGDFLVRPNFVDDVIHKLTENRIDHEIIIHDAESFLHENTRSQRFPRDVTETSEQRYRSKYLTYPEILRFLQYVNTSSNVNVQVGSIGKSFEGRDMPFIKIQSNDSWPGKRTIFIDAGVHSREWISPAMAVEIIHRLALNTEKDRAVHKLLEMFDWLVVPLVNPDGYVQTFSKGLEGRMWRKNRNKRYSTNPLCYGVDLNRNFGFQWNNSPEHGGSSNPCSGTFSGPRSFSEPETLNMGRLLLSNKDHIAGYISFHSFGQFFLYPWGFSSDVNIEDEPDLHHVASAFVDRMKRKDYIYNLGGSAKTLYPAAGGSDDYVRGVVGVKYAYTVELPPHENSRYGFLLPEKEVKSVVSDTWEGLKSFAFRLHQHTRATPFNTTKFRPVTNASDQQKDLLEEVSYRTVQNTLKGNFMDTLLNSMTSEKRYNRYRKSRARTNKKMRLHLSSKTN